MSYPATGLLVLRLGFIHHRLGSAFLETDDDRLGENSGSDREDESSDSSDAHNDGFVYLDGVGVAVMVLAEAARDNTECILIDGNGWVCRRAMREIYESQVGA